MDFMDASLQPVEHRVAAARIDELIVSAVLNQPAAVNGDDAVGPPYRRQPLLFSVRIRPEASR